MKKAFMSMKFYEGERTKNAIDEITEALRQADIENFVMIRDVEKWGKIHLTSDSLMPEYAFPEMDTCDMLIVEFSEKGVGLGLGAGYAYAKKIPIYIIAKTGSEISSTISGVANAIIFYDKPSDITKAFKEIEKRQNMKIILASKSKVRKEILEKANIPFEIKVSNADETVKENVSLEEKYKIISRRKAEKTMKETEDQGDRIIVSADQNIVFNDKCYEKPQTLEEAKTMIKSLMGHDVFTYVGNTVLVIEDNKIIDEICETDVSTIHVNKITDEELEEYISKVDVCSIRGGINILSTPFTQMVSGRKSTAEGMTIQYLKKLSYR